MAQPYALHLGDCLEVLPTLEAESIDALVTDPPAGIRFMGRTWDTDHGGRKGWCLAFEAIFRECYRVMKPGAHGLVWAIPRTSHWTATALEDAGFEVRDFVCHHFGQGFPKSLDVSKAIDKAGGTAYGWFGPWLRQEREQRGITQKELAQHFPSKTGGLTGCVANWELSLNLPTPEQFNRLCVVLELPFDRVEQVDREVIGQRERNGKPPQPMWGGADGQRWNLTAPATEAAKQWQGWGTALKPACEVWWLVRKPLAAPNVASQVLATGTGALNVDGCRVGTDAVVTRAKGQGASYAGTAERDSTGSHKWNGVAESTHTGRWPANVVLTCCGEEPHAEGCAVAELDRQSGSQVSGVAVQRNRDGEVHNEVYGARRTPPVADQGYSDSGGASRFFPTFRYTEEELEASPGFLYSAKASSRERSEGLPLGMVNRHPTVKPRALLQWMSRLCCRPGGVILDPFMGSGTGGVAAIHEGFRFIGIEKDEESYRIAEARIAHAVARPAQQELIG